MHVIATHPILSALVTVAVICLIVLVAQLVLIASGNDQEKMQFPWQ